MASVLCGQPWYLDSLPTDVDINRELKFGTTHMSLEPFKCVSLCHFIHPPEKVIFEHTGFSLKRRQYPGLWPDHTNV